MYNVDNDTIHIKHGSSELGLGFSLSVVSSAPLHVDSDQLLPAEPHRVRHHDGHLQLHPLIHLHEGQVTVVTALVDK